MGLWKQLEDFKKGHEVPTDSAVPDKGCSTGHRVCPYGLEALIVTVDKETTGGVTGMLLNVVILQNNIVPSSGLSYTVSGRDRVVAR